MSWSMNFYKRKGENELKRIFSQFELKGTCELNFAEFKTPRTKSKKLRRMSYFAEITLSDLSREMINNEAISIL